MRTPHNSPTRPWLTLALQAGLLVALGGAVWSVYRQLPREASEDATSAPRETLLRIVLLSAPGEGEAAAAGANVPVQLYPLDVASAQREYFNERRPGVRFEDFLGRRMGARQPLTVRLDTEGRAVVSVPQGRWWIHATLPAAGAHEVTWRLPVNVAGREQTAELTPTNAYMKTKSF
ncbi:MAG: hypothetical protein ACRD9R_18200 [Pyrinomonadaceae bacterium]